MQPQDKADDITRFKHHRTASSDELLLEDESCNIILAKMGFYRTLAKVALRLYPTPPYSCSSEMDFSVVKNITFFRRSSANSDLIGDMVYFKFASDNVE